MKNLIVESLLNEDDNLERIASVLKAVFPRLQAIHKVAKKNENQYVALYTGQSGLPTIAVFEKDLANPHMMKLDGVPRTGEWKFYNSRAPTALDLKLLNVKLQVIDLG